jgi:hypothetical protein
MLRTFPYFLQAASKVSEKFSSLADFFVSKLRHEGIIVENKGLSKDWRATGHQSREECGKSLLCALARALNTKA